MDLTSPVTALPGIGSARAAALKRLNIETVYDLITDFPRTYEDRTRLVPICELEVDKPACFEAMVIRAPRTSYIRQGLNLTKLAVADSTGTLNLVYFNQPYAAEALEYGREYCFYGTLRGDYSRTQMQNPLFEPVERQGSVTRCIVPVYSLAAGISPQILRRTIGLALSACLPTLPEVLPRSVLESQGLMGAREAYQMIHNPPSMDALEAARRRIVFEEFFLFTVGLLQLRASRRAESTPPMKNLSLARFLAALPFAPTAAQRRAVEEITADFARGTAMNRLLQGDVGSGKTLVAAAAACLAVQNGLQAAIMAPTEILAEQHLTSFAAFLAPLGIKPALLTGSLSAGEKRRIKEGLAGGTIQVVVGTHALLTEDVAFQSLGLVVADEQHRFGVAQRAALRAKGTSPHLLVMSATPIPRTLAMMLYGDLDVSILDELPPGRQKVDTFLVGEAMRARINAFIRKQAAAGHQVYVVCPAVEEQEGESVKSVEAWADTLRRTVFPDLRVGLIHGRLKAVEKEAVMADFAAHKLDVLVATTVIEVGVDVPNATLMVIENADRFGLSQLHQLRGRVGRGKEKSYCVLFSSNQNPETKARLQTLVKSSNGFEIAEADLAQRGPGDFFGSRQHGLPQFKAASLTLDMALLKSAQEAAAAAMADAQLPKDPCFPALRLRVQALFRGADAP